MSNQPNNAGTPMTATLTVIPIPPGFWTDGSCHDLPADWFHPERGESTSNAKTVCATCTIRVPCLTWALDNNEKFGIWGGTSERERRRIRRRMALDQAVPELDPEWAPKTRLGPPRRLAPVAPARSTAPVPPKEERPVELTTAPSAAPPATNGSHPTDPDTGLPTDACVNCGVTVTRDRDRP